MASTRLPSPKSLVGAPTQILAQFPKQHQQSPKQQLHPVQQQTQQQVAQPAPVSHQQQPQQSPLPPGIKPTIQIKQESGNWKILQDVILPQSCIYRYIVSSGTGVLIPNYVLRASCWKYLYRKNWSLGIEMRKKTVCSAGTVIFNELSREIRKLRKQTRILELYSGCIGDMESRQLKN